MKLGLGLRNLRQVSSGPVAAVWTGNANVSVVDIGSGYYRITKTGGTNGSFTDASASTTSARAGDFTLYMKRGEVTGEVLAGINDTPNGLHTSIERGVDWNGVDAISFETGYAGLVNHGAHVATEYSIIKRVGSVISLYETTNPDVPGAAIRTYTTSAATFFGDAILGNIGNTIDVKLV